MIGQIDMTKQKIGNQKPVSISSSSVFSDYAHYYDLLYRDKNYNEEADYITGLIQKFYPSARSILELGSGTGKHAVLLAEKGFNIYGIERSEEMLNRAKAIDEGKNLGSEELTFSKGDIREVRVNKRFDVVLSLFHVISYQTTNKDVKAAFETARYHLNAGGVFIFDVWYGPAVLTEQPEVRIKRMEDDKIEVTRLAEPVLHPNENLVEVNYHVFIRDRESGHVKELKEVHKMRYFFKPEIELISDHAEFKLIHTEEWLTKADIHNTTWGVCFVLMAR